MTYPDQGWPGGEEKIEKKKHYAHYLTMTQFFELNEACRTINKTFDGFGCYLVGSALTRPDWRDVDIRFIGDNDDVLFKSPMKERLVFMQAVISHWLSLRTGLPIDFQFQSQEEANTKYPSGAIAPVGNRHLRNAMGH